jgi:hypothetical protein
MDLYAVLDQVIDLLRGRKRVTYRLLKSEGNGGVCITDAQLVVVDNSGAGIGAFIVAPESFVDAPLEPVPSPIVGRIGIWDQLI